MKFSDLFYLNEWIHDKANESNLLENFSILSSILQHNKSPSKNVNGRLVPHALKEFKEPKENLFESLKQMDTSILNKNQKEILNINGILDYLGKEASSNLEALFTDNYLDIAYIANAVSEREQKIKSALVKIKNEAKSIEDYRESKYERAHNIDITFKNSTSIKNFKDLQEQAKQWNKITHSISASIPSDDKIEITNVENGSIIIGLLGTSAALFVTAHIIRNASLLIRTAIIESKEIYKLINLDTEDPAYQEEVKALRETLDKISQKKTDNAISSAIEKIIKDSKKFLKEGNETENHLRAALKGVVRHLAGGGDAEVTISDKDRKSIEDNGFNTDEINELCEKHTPLSISTHHRELIEQKIAPDDDHDEAEH